MSIIRSKIYPMGGSNDFEADDMVITKSFRIDAGTQATGTAPTVIFKKGDLIFGFCARVTEAVTSDGSGTVQLGFTGTRMLSVATIAKTTLVLNYIVGPDQTNGAENCPYMITADDTFDCIVGTATLTAGKFDVDVFYAPLQTQALGEIHREWVTA